MKWFFKSTVLASALSLIACGGGSGGGNKSTGGVYFTHEQLADEFVRRVNIDVSGYDLTLVKTNTQQFDYIVVYDNWADTYDAYWLGNYNPGENLSNYLYNYDYKFYYDLVPKSGNLYQDFYTGIYFANGTPVSKDLGFLQSVKEDAVVATKAKDLKAKYGMNDETAFDTARFAYKIKTAKPGTYTLKDYDGMAMQLTGSTITDLMKDVKESKWADLRDRVSQMAEKTGMGAAGMRKLIREEFKISWD